MEKKIAVKYPLFRSSVDPNTVSLTIKGVLVGLIPVIIAIASAFGVTLAESDLMQLVESIATIVSAGMVIWGLVRKFLKK